MARLARLVVPGLLHHVTQRGVRLMAAFFRDRDYRAHLDPVAEGRLSAGTAVIAVSGYPTQLPERSI